MADLIYRRPAPVKQPAHWALIRVMGLIGGKQLPRLHDLLQRSIRLQFISTRRRRLVGEDHPLTSQTSLPD